jgi:hypothetical protein
MDKNYKQFPPIMEGLLDFGVEIKLSLDFGSSAAPNGTIDFFDKYGYLVIDDLFKFDGKNHEDGCKLIEKILTEKIKLSIEKENNYECLFTSKNTSVPKIKSDLSAIYQHYTNLDSVPLYIETRNKEHHCVALNPGRIIVIDNKLKISYCPSFLNKIKNKLKTVRYYFHQVIFGYNFT